MVILFALACAEAPVPGGSAPASMPATGRPAQAWSPVTETQAAVRIVATGDVLLHERVQNVAQRKRYDGLFAETRPLIEAADIAFANLETPIAPETGKPIVPLRFNAPPEALAGLRGAGFDIVSFANNHVYDQGRKGFIETLDHLDAAGLVVLGAGRTCAEAADAHVVEHNGLKIAFLGTSRWYNDRANAGVDEPCADRFDALAIIARAAAARQGGADAVVLSIHWGREYETAPSADQVADAHRMVEGGVDLILGHHSHVLGPIEVFHASDGRVGVIAYSLGNYVSNQSAWYEAGLNPASSANPRDGVLLSVRVVRRAYGRGRNEVIRTELADLEATPLWTYNNQVTRGSEAPDIGVEPLLDRIQRLRSEMQLLMASTDEADPAQVVRLGQEIEELERRWRGVGRILGEQFLIERNAVPTREDR